MSLTRRGRWTVATSSLVVLVGVAVGFFAVSGRAPAFIRTVAAKVGIAPPPAPPTCPLTGKPAPHGVVPRRPVLAVKVENLPEARPQAGLQNADIVYEEPVEGGITRFIALYQCHDAPRIGPVRSGRTTDPEILVQYGRPILGYAGGAGPVVRAIDRAGLIDENFLVAVGAYVRDPNRPAPHNLYTSSEKLYAAARSKAAPPDPVFTYSRDLPERSRRVRTLHLDFSSYSDVYWKWNARDRRWERFHGDVPHTLETGVQVSATNVLVQVVKVVPGPIVDAAGNPSPVVTLTGGGKAYVLRDGRLIVGRWQRDSLSDVTRFVTRTGEEIPLAPGNTWIELLPDTIAVQATN